MRLAADNNPNIIELLFVEESDILKISKSGHLLRENRDMFLSRRVRFSFAGFAFSQLIRIENHRRYLLNPPTKKPERKDYNLPEHKLITKDQQEAFIWILANIIKNTKEATKLSHETLEELNNFNFHGVLQSKIGVFPDETWGVIQNLTGGSDNFIYAMKQERAYANALNDWNAFLKYKDTRNTKRAALEAKCGYDSKHAYTLVRILREGVEILKGEGVKVRRPDAMELIEIKNGGWPFGKLKEYANEMESKLKGLYEVSSLPREPNKKKINELCQQILCDELYADIAITLI
jgi:hypothetical protein